jgi:hypothetical protein
MHGGKANLSFNFTFKIGYSEKCSFLMQDSHLNAAAFYSALQFRVTLQI